MTPGDDAPSSRRAAREARRAGSSSSDPSSDVLGTGLQPPLSDDGPSAAPDLTKADPAPDPVEVRAAAGPDAEPVGTLTPELLGRRARRTGGLAQAGAEDFSLVQAVGGVRGAAETLVPGLLFVVAYTATRDLTIALVLSVGAALLAIVLRLVTRSGPTQALSGAVGVGICAVFALLSGEARNFYLPGFLTNVAYGLLCLLSTVPFRRFPLGGREIGPGPYPLIGLLLGPLTGEGLAWRQVPARLKVYQRVTWLWAGFFLLRLVVQVPLYLADLVGALGAARLVMGVPAFALMVWISWLLLRSVPPAVPAEKVVPPTEQAGQSD